MKVGFYGFSFKEGTGISLQEFGDLLVAASSQTKEQTYGSHDRLFLFDGKTNPHFYLGLLITIKDQKTFCQLRKQGNKFSIAVSELEEGNQLMDFNFFVLHKQNFTGIYQHYHNSFSVTQFCYFARQKFYKPERDDRIAAAEKEIAAKKPELKKDDVAKQAKNKFKKNLTFDLVYTQSDFDEILEKMSEIKGFQYDISSARVANDGLTPHGIPLSKTTRHVYFEKRNGVKEIATALATFVKDKAIKKGKVTTVDDAGEVRIVDIIHNVKGFGEFDFDDVAPKIALDLDKFANCWLIDELLKAAKENKTFLGFPDA